MLDDFLAKYRKGDIVYPSAVARYLGIAVEKAYKLLEGRSDVCPIFVVRCPFCSHLVKRWYSISDLPDDEEIGCEHCDTVFTPTKYDIIVLYEKNEKGSYFFLFLPFYIYQTISLRMENFTCLKYNFLQKEKTI